MNKYFHYFSNCAGRNWLGVSPGEETEGGWKSAWNGHFFLCLPVHSVLEVQLVGPWACYCFSSSFSKSTILLLLSLREPLLALLACWERRGEERARTGSGQEGRGKSWAGAIIAITCHHTMGPRWRKSSPSF